MMTPEQRKQYDAIRPFEPDELPEVYDRLLKDPQVQQVMAYLYPGVPVEMLSQKCMPARPTSTSRRRSATTS